MRQTVRSAGLLSLFLLNLTTLPAEPLLRGFFIEKLPEKVASKELAPDKGLVLAHVFNVGSQAMTSGSYQVGVEIESAGKKKTFVLNPRETISAGGLKTFRMAVPVNSTDKSSGQFRIFSKARGNTTWSEKYSFLQGVVTDGDKKVTTLYTEALPEPSSIRPPKEVPFENEKSARKAAELEQKVKAVAVKKVPAKGSSIAKAPEAAVAKTAQQVKATETAKPVKIAQAPAKEEAARQQKAVKEDKTVKAEKPAKAEKAPARETVVAAAPAKAVEEEVQRPRNIDPAEFKKLRTIDEELIIYVVKEGDSLKSVAEKYYGSASKERAIADLNFIEKSSSVKVGEEIIVDVRPLNKSGKSNS